MSEVVPHTLRPAEAKDRPFWGANWANSYRSSKYAGVVPNHLYHDVMRVLQDGLLKRGMQVVLAHLPDEPDALMGFVAWEQHPKGPIVHMVYVKDTWRRNGLATAMLDSAVPGRRFLYTHRTKDSEYFARPKWQVGYSPDPARRKDL